jgi:hypothetical protein
VVWCRLREKELHKWSQLHLRSLFFFLMLLLHHRSDADIVFVVCGVLTLYELLTCALQSHHYTQTPRAEVSSFIT